jgi:hypothetical protein
VAKRNREITLRKIQKWIKEGRGQGEGENYKPWLTVQDVPSNGLASRKKGRTCNREHHLMSNLERDYFYLLDFSDSVTDIREQYPLLPIDETLLIAEKLGISHPTDPKTGEPIVMTTDFLITMNKLNVARTVKPENELNDDRTIQKLEIERRYWKERNIDWGIVTEKEIPKVIVRNIAWFEDEYDNADIVQMGTVLTEHLESTLLKHLQSEHPINRATALCDEALGLVAGTGLAFFRYMLARKYWRIDLSEPINPHSPINKLHVVSTMQRSLA